MKSNITTSSLLAIILATASSSSAAAVGPPTARIALSDDQTGAYAFVDVPMDTIVRPIPELWLNTPIHTSKGAYTATSVTLLDGQANRPTCSIVRSDDNDNLAKLDVQTTFVKLGKTPNVSSEVDLSLSSITCYR